MKKGDIVRISFKKLMEAYNSSCSDNMIKDFYTHHVNLYKYYIVIRVGYDDCLLGAIQKDRKDLTYLQTLTLKSKCLVLHDCHFVNLRSYA